MAILSKIRERSLFLIIIIALALFSFVIGDVFTRGSSGGGSTSVGEINGENISREEFATLVEQQRANSGNQGSQLQHVNAAWNVLLREHIYKSQLEKAGLSLGEKAVWDELLNQPFVQNSPQFKNEAGLFDEEIFKEYIASLQDGQNESEQGRNNWLSWIDYEKSVKANLEQRTYNSLINAGLGSTLKEGEQYYFDNNTKLNLEYVFVPFSSISDSLVKISDAEISDYIKAHPDQFKVEASRDISFVKFDIKANAEDEAELRKKVVELVKDTVEFVRSAGREMEKIGLANATDLEDFFANNESDLPLDLNYYTNTTLSPLVSDTIFKLKKDDVYGPYKDAGFFKLSKITDIRQMPDSVKTSHILIPYAGAMRVDPSITRTEDAAKKLTDSLFAIVKRDKSKFSDLAKSFSTDLGSGAKGGDLGWIVYNSGFTPEFRDYAFENKTGDMEIVKSPFGFHIIDITDQKNIQKSVQVATFGRRILASEETESAIYQKAETFSSSLVDGKDLNELAKEQNLAVQPVIGLKALDERVSNLNTQREIVQWTFNKDTQVGDIKRFDLVDGYAVVRLDAAHKKGLGVGNSKTAVRLKLMHEKKSALIKDKMTGSDLAGIASAANSTVQTSNAVSLGVPVLPGVGRDEGLIRTLVGLKEGKLYNKIETQTGVIAVKISQKEMPLVLENYAGPAKQVLNTYKTKGGKLYAILRNLTDIEDNRADFY